MGLIGRHLGGLLDFQGREGRKEFWPWAIFVALASMVIFPTFLSTVVPPYENSAGDPDILAEQLARVFHLAFVSAIVAVALSSAAVVRRLRDAGRSSVWAIPPLVLLAAFPAITGWLWAGVLSAASLRDNPYARGLELIPGLFLVTLACWAVLVVLLALPQRDQATLHTR